MRKGDPILPAAKNSEAESGLTKRVESGNLTSEWLEPGSKIRVADQDFVIEKVIDGRELGKQLGLEMKRAVPVYYLDGYSLDMQGAYHPATGSVLIFKSTTNEGTIKHELVHAVEFGQEISSALSDLYERVKSTISEDSFTGSFKSFNFVKNIHEFIADGHSKEEFIEALRKEGFYEDFIRETRYLFEAG